MATIPLDEVGHLATLAVGLKNGKTTTAKRIDPEEGTGIPAETGSAPLFVNSFLGRLPSRESGVGERQGYQGQDPGETEGGVPWSKLPRNSMNSGIDSRRAVIGDCVTS